MTSITFNLTVGDVWRLALATHEPHVERVDGVWVLQHLDHDYVAVSCSGLYGHDEAAPHRVVASRRHQAMSQRESLEPGRGRKRVENDGVWRGNKLGPATHPGRDRGECW